MEQKNYIYAKWSDTTHVCLLRVKEADCGSFTRKGVGA